MERSIVSRADWLVLRELHATAALRRKLEHAVIVQPELVPHDVVTLGSRFTCTDEQSGESSVVTLVRPLDAFRRPGRVSVLAPVGTAVLGAASGQTVSVEERRLRIGRVLYQPERERYVAAPMAP